MLFFYNYSTPNNCGACNNACPDHKDCSDEKCKGCIAGYHDNEGICDSDDSDKCGSHGYVCDLTQHRLCQTASTNQKSIQYQCYCDTRYLVFLNEAENTEVCELNDDQNCGMHGKACTPSSLAISAECRNNDTVSTSGTSSNATCNDTACKAGDQYALCSGTCVDLTTTEHCGSCSKSCTTKNGTASCVSGECQYTCASGFNPSASGCVPND